MYSCNKNSYLQGHFQDINAGLLNRSVQKAWDELHNVDEYDLQPPYMRLTSEQPHIPVENVDPTRRPQGYGRWAMSKLRRELHHKDAAVVEAALTSISDLVHDAERGYEAIRIKVVDRLVDLLYHERPAIRERTALTLKVLAGSALGTQAIISNNALLANLLDLVEDPFTEVRIQVAGCLEKISRYWIAVDSLVEAGFIQVLLTNLLDCEEVVEIHLETLKMLLYCDGVKIALDEDGFQIMMKLFERDEGNILYKSCEVLLRLCIHPEGRKMAQQNNILPVLNRLLHDERTRVQMAAAEAIMFCTIKSSEKIIASKIPSMPKRLVQLCKNKLEDRDHISTQLFAIQALISICEHPLIRKEVRTNYFKDVEAIQLNEHLPEIQTHKNTLICLLKWEPHSNEVVH